MTICPFVKLFPETLLNNNQKKGRNVSLIKPSNVREAATGRVALIAHHRENQVRAIVACFHMSASMRSLKYLSAEERGTVKKKEENFEEGKFCQQKYLQSEEEKTNKRAE